MEKTESWILADWGLSPGNGRRVEGEKSLRSFARERLYGAIYACPRTSEIEKMLEINI